MIKNIVSLIVGLIIGAVIGILAFPATEERAAAPGTNFPNGITTTTLTATTLSAATTSVDVFTQGGGVYAVATSGTAYTLTQAEIANVNVIDFRPLGAAATLTLPATSTLTTVIPNAGDYRQWVIRNSATAATTTTIAAGAGIDLQEPDGQNVVIGNTNFAWVTCYRKLDTDVVCLIDESIPAD